MEGLVVGLFNFLFPDKIDKKGPLLGRLSNAKCIFFTETTLKWLFSVV